MSMNPLSPQSPSGHPTEDKAFWLQHVAQYQDTSASMSRKAYCQVHELSYHRFQYWYRKAVSPTTASVIPVRVKSPEKATTEVLCTLALGDKSLLIHTLSALDHLLGRSI